MTPVLIFFIFLLGAIIGSFLNVVIFRLPKRRKFLHLKQRSRCLHCRKVLASRDLIPIASYLLLRGRCRFCKKPIHPQYVVVELLTAGIFVALYVQYDLQLAFFTGAVGACSLLALAFIDGRHKIVPDSLSVPTIAVLFVLQAIGAFQASAWVFDGAFWSTIAGTGLAMLLAAGWFWLQWFFSRGRWVGSGDIRLGALLGAYLGLPGVALALFSAYMSGSVWAAYLLARGRVKLKSQLPFGVFLGAAGIAAYLFGPSVIHWYRDLIGL